MKIVCDCGQEMEFEIDETTDDPDEEINASYDSNEMYIVGAHDEVWITCQKCKKSIHFFA